VIQSCDLVFKSVAGTETLRIDGETGLITGAASGCPTDMRTGGTFCIETTDRGGQNRYGAVDTCFNLGRRLCTGEAWMAACRNISGLSNMTNNWEWVSDLSRSDEQAAMMHSCADSNWSHWNSGRNFRCCRDL
jgi:hypothetical protein